jgi:hypothetical protein
MLSILNTEYWCVIVDHRLSCIRRSNRACCDASASANDRENVDSGAISETCSNPQIRHSAAVVFRASISDPVKGDPYAASFATFK